MLLGIADRFRQTVHARGGHSDNMKSKALGGLVSNPGQRREFIDQFINVARI
jgi:hypothetical protein